MTSNKYQDLPEVLRLQIEAVSRELDGQRLREQMDQNGTHYVFAGRPNGALYVRRTTAEGQRVVQAWFDRGILLAVRDSSGSPEAPDGGVFFFNGDSLVAADALHGDPMPTQDEAVTAMAQEAAALAAEMRAIASSYTLIDSTVTFAGVTRDTLKQTAEIAQPSIPMTTEANAPDRLPSLVATLVIVGVAGILGLRRWIESRRSKERPRVASLRLPEPMESSPVAVPARQQSPKHKAAPLTDLMDSSSAQPDRTMTVVPELLAEAIRRTRMVPFVNPSPWPVPGLVEPGPVAWQVPLVECSMFDSLPPAALSVLPGKLVFSTPAGPMSIDLGLTVLPDHDEDSVPLIFFSTIGSSGKLYLGTFAPIAESIRAFAPVLAICELCQSSDDDGTSTRQVMARTFRSLDAVNAWVREVMDAPTENTDSNTETPTSWQTTATTTNKTATTLHGDAFVQRVQRAVGREYRIIEQVGQGGFGALFKAHQVNLDRQVAIKVLLPTNADDPQFVVAFRKEARLIAGLEHPHIVPINQFGVGDGIWWLSMRWIDFKSRQEVMSEYGSLDACLGLMRQIASALDFAHERRVVHRDIKLPNILISRTGHAYVADFGIAAELESSRDEMAGSGSYPFMPPEQFSGDGIGPATDQYALGQVVHELLTGGRLAVTAPDGNWLRAAVSGKRTVDAKLPEQVRRAIIRALAPDPAERFPSVTAFIEAMALAGDTQMVEPRKGRLPHEAIDGLARRAPAELRNAPRAPRQSNRQRPARNSPLAARHAKLPALETWWLEHLRDLTDPTVEKGDSLAADRPTMRHQRLWAEATAWLDSVRGIVLNDLPSPWRVHPNQWQIGRLSYTYWGRIVPEDGTGLDDAFHVGVQLSKRLKWVPKLEPSLRHLADTPVIAVWGSTNDRLIESRGLEEERWQYGRLMHLALVDRPELWRSGGALVRYTDPEGTTRLVRPETYFREIGGPESDIGNCDLFSPILTLDEVLRDPADAGRRVAGFIRLLAEIVADARTGLTNA